jgi:hypothetical protein
LHEKVSFTLAVVGAGKKAPPFSTGQVMAVCRRSGGAFKLKCQRQSSYKSVTSIEGENVGHGLE